MKNLFIILVSILLVLVLLYFYNDREDYINKRYSYNNNYIIYPYFGNDNLDLYVNKFVKRYINRKLDYLFIDYDYVGNYLTMYVYGVDSGMIINNSDSYFIDKNNSNYDIIYNKSSSNKKMVALTFDDGPNYNTNRVLDILDKYGVKATFFVLGCNIKGNEEIIKRMDKLGMEIGNHMYSHKLVSKLSKEKIIREIDMVDDLVNNIVGYKTTLIRPSYGSYNKKFKGIVDKDIIRWNIDTLDWKYHNSKRIYNKVVNNVKNGDIILMHDIYSASANSLDMIIPKLLNDGYSFVTVSELLYNKGK